MNVAHLPQALKPSGLVSTAWQARRSLLEIGWQRRSIVATAVAAAFVVGLLYYAQVTPIYQSKSQVLVVKKRPDTVTGIDTRHLAIEDYVATHQALIKSPLIIERAIQRRNLAQLECFAGKDDLIESISKALTVTRQKTSPGSSSNILDLAFQGTRAAECATVLNALIDSYKDFLDETYRNTSEDTVKLVTQARDVLHKDLREDEIAYRNFRRDSPLLLLRGKEGTNLTHERLSSIESKRSTLLLRKAEIQGHLAALESGLKRGGNREALLAMIAEAATRLEAESHRSADTLTMQNQLYPLQQEEHRLLASKGENHPEVLAVRERIEHTRLFLASPVAAWKRRPEKAGATQVAPVDEIDMFRQYFTQQLNHVEGSEKLLGDLFKEQSDAAKAMTAYELEDESFRTGLARKQKLYDTLIKRLQDIDLIKEVGGYDARTIAAPLLGKKIQPSALQVFPLTLCLGFLGGFGLAYLVEIRDKSFQSVDEVRRRLGLPVVGQIPRFKPIAVELMEALTNGRMLAPILCTYHRPKSVDAESYRGVRTALYFSTRGEGNKVIQITSPSAGDGKSTLAANLAVSIAQSGKKVLLIDADLRKPTIHKIFNLSVELGLVSVIADDVEPRDAIQESGIPDLSILPCGPLPPNPAELLISHRFPEFLACMREQYDYVLLDTPPLLAVTDPSVVAPRVDGVILNVRLTQNGRPQAERAKEILEALGVKLFGVVVNDADLRTDASGYSYGYGYSEGYHSDGEKKTSPKRIAVTERSEAVSHIVNGTKDQG